LTQKGKKTRYELAKLVARRIDVTASTKRASEKAAERVPIKPVKTITLLARWVMFIHNHCLSRRNKPENILNQVNRIDDLQG
jgi:hypothetical protein